MGWVGKLDAQSAINVDRVFRIIKPFIPIIGARTPIIGTGACSKRRFPADDQALQMGALIRLSD